MSQSNKEDEDTLSWDGFEEQINVKSKRRKTNAIASDSEDDRSEPTNQPKRRRIARARSDSTESYDKSDAGSDAEDRSKQHGRRNIRKVMGENELGETTKKATREEKERLARVAERQKLYNNYGFDESAKPGDVVLDKVILDFDAQTKAPLIEVDRGLVKKLKPHQANGIKFMWDACYESVKQIKRDKGSGCILAHCMGLGKTLQVISLTHTLLTHGSLTGVNRVLVVCPLSTVLNWVNEFRMWLKHAEKDFKVDVYELTRYKSNVQRAFVLQQWFQGGGVCVLNYHLFCNLSADKREKFNKKMLGCLQQCLVTPGPDLIVCDEGHLVKNEKTIASQSLDRVRTRRRIVLTGTPLQNNLREYYCMLQFVKPNLLGEYKEYLNRFVNPITNGQYADSTEDDIRIMRSRSHVLHKMLEGTVQRRDYSVLAPYLPPKHEYALFITLTDVQIKLYQHYLDNYSRRPKPGKFAGYVFPDFQSLQRICTHPLTLKYHSERFEIMHMGKVATEDDDSRGSLSDFIDDDDVPEDAPGTPFGDNNSKNKKEKKGVKNEALPTVSLQPGTSANPDDHENDDSVGVEGGNPTKWWVPLVCGRELEDLRSSHKLVLLFDILRQCEAIGDKLLVFSQSLYSLDLIEQFLFKMNAAMKKDLVDEALCGHAGSWTPGLDYFRLDGSTSCENRSTWCENFNREDNPRARLFLISTRAGGLGINLVAANRVVIFDVSWNPSHDVQSLYRVYRFGQKKPCYMYRFISMGTMEHTIYERQVTKQAVSKRVIDEQQIGRHYAAHELAVLYRFEPRGLQPRPLPALPTDRLFAEILRERELQIYKYHEHDSLLENKVDERLSEEERKVAWKEFEDEKNEPTIVSITAWPGLNGIRPELVEQRQQQLGVAVLTAVLRKMPEFTNLTPNEILNLLLQVYLCKPALKYEIRNLYFKYFGPTINPVLEPVAEAELNPKVKRKPNLGPYDVVGPGETAYDHALTGAPLDSEVANELAALSDITFDDFPL